MLSSTFWRFQEKAFCSLHLAKPLLSAKQRCSVSKQICFKHKHFYQKVICFQQKHLLQKAALLDWSAPGLNIHHCKKMCKSKRRQCSRQSDFLQCAHIINAVSSQAPNVQFLLSPLSKQYFNGGSNEFGRSFRPVANSPIHRLYRRYTKTQMKCVSSQKKVLRF